jgi:hypothetical protein
LTKNFWAKFWAISPSQLVTLVPMVVSGSATRLGEISQFGRHFLALGAFSQKNIAQMIWAQFFFKTIAQNSH